MCEPVSIAMGVITAAASIGSAVYSNRQQKKAAREQELLAQQTERKQKALIEAKGASQVSRTDTAAAEVERKRRNAVMNNNSILPSRQGVLGTPNTAGTSLSGQQQRSTLG